MPSAIHVCPTTAPHPRGKQSVPSSKAPSTKDSGHLYTDANSVANYLLPTPSRSLPEVPHGPTRWCPQQQQQQQTFGSAAATAKTARLRTDDEYIHQVD